MYKGVQIDFKHTVQGRDFAPPIRFGDKEMQAMQRQIDIMERKGIIEKAKVMEGQYVSNIFCCSKKDESVRIILNLKSLNKFVDYHHYKMDTLQSAIGLMT